MADNSPLDNSDLADIEALLNDLDPSDLDLLDPPAEVWAGIVQALTDEAATDEAATDEAATDEAATDEAATDEAATDEAATDETTQRGGNVVSLASRRNRFLAPVLGIAAAAVLLIGGIVVFNGRSSDAEVVASAVLEFGDGFDELGTDAAATAELLDGDGDYEIALADADLPDPSGEDADLELWLIEVGADGGIVDLVSLGIVDDPDQTFEVPADIDPAAYSVVDISVEPHDGNHDHSGRSILRGQLSA